MHDARPRKAGQVYIALGAVLCAVSTVLLWSAAAAANIAASQRMPAELVGPHAIRPTPLEVRSERLTFDCHQHQGEPDCDFVALYQIANPTDTVQGVTAAFYGVGVRQVEATLDGRSVLKPLRPHQRTALDMLVVQAESAIAPLSGVAPTDRRGVEVDRVGMDFEVAPGASGQLRVSGKIKPGRFFRPPGLIKPAPSARHALLGTQKPSVVHYDVDYLLSPLKTWAAVGPIEIEVRHPADWSMRGGVMEVGQWRQRPQNADWSVRTEKNQRIHRLNTHVDAGARLYLHFGRFASAFYHGGPLLGAGFELGGGDGVMVRGGWEVAAPSWVLYELSLQSNLDDTATGAFVLKAAAPQVYVIPSMALGAGAVGRRRTGQLQPGGRLHFDVHHTFGALVLLWDFYPGARDGSDLLLMGQLSF